MARTAEQVRAELTKLIGEGRFANRGELNSHIASLGLGQTRNAADYVTVVTETGERVRLYLSGNLLRSPVEVESSKRRRDGSTTFSPGLKGEGPSQTFSIYIIAAVAPNGDVAAYVGSTGMLRRRLAEHFHGRENTSVDLANWARLHGARAYAQEVMCTNTRAGSVQLEGFITSELERWGWFLPGVTRWGAARRTAQMMTKSFRRANIGWSEPRAEDIVKWPPVSHYKFYA